MLHSSHASDPPVPTMAAAAAYDTLTMATHNDILRLTTPNSGHSGAMDAFDHDFKFDADGLL